MANPLFSRLCLTAVVLVMLLAGCAAIEKQETRSTEQLLSAAGFDIKPADTPDKLATLRAMKQNKLVRRQTKDGKLQFLYADAAVCRCVYVGDEQAYQRYQDLAVQQQIAIADQEAELDASMDTPWAYDWGAPD
jgi:predicted nucleic acid-binding protein